MRFLSLLLSKAVRTGDLRVIGPDGAEKRFGDGSAPNVTMRIHDATLDRRIALNPELAPAEAFMEGGLTIDEGGAYALLHLFFVNKRHFDLTPSQIFWRGMARGAKRAVQHNTPGRARRNVAHHYDLGDPFYRLWLDGNLQYSCGYFPDGDETLEAAQLKKLRHIAAKMALAPGQRVLDIGCGWGGAALYLALAADVEVVGVTLSERQLAVAQARAAHLGLSDQVRFELRDYRAVTETFDRVVSVGMLEHVGAHHLTPYFLSVRDRLGPEGVALIHTISSKAPPGVTGPFLRKYIFPGGYAPSLSEMTAAIEKSGLWCTDMEIWRVHYGLTIQHWRARFEAARAQVEAMYDARFARMWEFYLAAVELVFTHGASHVAQAQLARERDLTPLHRDYVGPAAARLAAAEADKDVAAKLFASTEAVLGPAPDVVDAAAPATAGAAPEVESA